MRRGLFCLAAAILAVQAVPASAGLYTDDLTRCVVAKSTDADKLALMRWVFSAMSAHPAVADLSKTTAEQRTAIARQSGDLMIRLLFDDCHAQSVAAIKYEGPESLKSSFEVLGKIAMQGLMTDPAVQNGMASLGTPTATEKLKALAKEAGVLFTDTPAK